MVDKKHRSLEENVYAIEKAVYPQNLYDYFTIKYYQEKLSCEQIGNELHISAASVRRYMKFVGVNLRSKEQCLKRLHNHTKGRKWTNQKAKKNISEGVKRSYDTIEGLRERRSKDNLRVWNEMSEEEKKSRYTPGLFVMHSKKRKVR